MTLAKQLEQAPHREVSGSRAYAAFEFQLMFGVELLFENFEELEDYAVLFEFHDDIVLVVGASSPAEISFYQIKHTTKGNWSLASLKSAPKKAGAGTRDQSILQKMYGNVHAFSAYAKNALVVSNTYCTALGELVEGRFNRLPEEQGADLLSHLRNVYPDAKADCLEILGFRRTELDKYSCMDLVKGRIHTFLQKQLGGDAFHLDACVNAIVGQCRQKNIKLATEVSGDVRTIVAQKGVSKTDLTSWLKEIESNQAAPNWNDIQPYLGNGWNFSHQNSVRLAYQKHKVSVLDSSNDAQNAVLRAIRKAIEELTPEEPLSKYTDLLIGEFDLNICANDNGFNVAQLEAMVLYEVFMFEQTGTV